MKPRLLAREAQTAVVLGAAKEYGFLLRMLVQMVHHQRLQPGVFGLEKEPRRGRLIRPRCIVAVEDAAVTAHPQLVSVVGREDDGMNVRMYGAADVVKATGRIAYAAIGIDGVGHVDAKERCAIIRIAWAIEDTGIIRTGGAAADIDAVRVAGRDGQRQIPLTIEVGRLGRKQPPHRAPAPIIQIQAMEREADGERRSQRIDDAGVARVHGQTHALHVVGKISAGFAPAHAAISRAEAGSALAGGVEDRCASVIQCSDDARDRSAWRDIRQRDVLPAEEAGRERRRLAAEESGQRCAQHPAWLIGVDGQLKKAAAHQPRPRSARSRQFRLPVLPAVGRHDGADAKHGTAGGIGPAIDGFPRTDVEGIFIRRCARHQRQRAHGKRIGAMVLRIQVERFHERRPAFAAIFRAPDAAIGGADVDTCAVGRDGDARHPARDYGSVTGLSFAHG